MKIRFSTILPAFLLTVPAVAQYDTIHLTDGKSQDRVKVVSFDFKQLVFKRGSAEQTIRREKVFRVDLGQTKVIRVFQAARKAAADEDFASAYQQYLKAAETLAKKQDTAVFAQFAYWNAFQLALKVGTAADRKECMEGITGPKGESTSAFWPDVWRYRIARDLGSAGNDRKRLTAAKKRIEAYRDWVQEKGASERYRFEGDLELILARGRLRELTIRQIQDELQSLLPRVEGVYPDLANRVNLEFANAVLAGSKNDDARKLYSVICASKVADAETKARAFLGRGHSWFRVKNRAADDAKRALLDYMRVVIHYPDDNQEVVAEALYHAILAYSAWNGPDREQNIRRLKSRLKIKYADTSWADK